jgi:hypothetical protein
MLVKAYIAFYMSLDQHATNVSITKVKNTISFKVTNGTTGGV